MTVTLIELVDVCRRYDGDTPVVALRDVNLVIPVGDSVAIVGPSGSGKSTLLHIIGCLDRPTSGTYCLDGIDTGDIGDGLLASLRGQRIGFVFQSFHLLSFRTAIDNVMLAEVYLRRPRAGRRDRALAALDRVGLAARAEHLPSAMSGGERQRVAIARALVTEPPLLLCDEPTGNLDSANTAGVLALIDGLRADNLTVVMITHDPSVAAHANRIVGMVDGQLIEHVTDMGLLPAGEIRRGSL
jgi:ABC-type lipoprotein export system ATPase subunit